MERKRREIEEECVWQERMMEEEMRGDVTHIGQFSVKMIATICCIILRFNERDGKKEKENRRIMCMAEENDGRGNERGCHSHSVSKGLQPFVVPK